MSVSPRSEKFNMVSNDHGRKQKCDFCVPLFKTNFTDHHKPDIIYMVLETWFRSVKCMTVTVRCTKISSISIPSHNVSQCKRLQWLDYMETNHFKMLLNLFSTTYAYSVCIVYQLFDLLKNKLTNIFSKICKIGMNLWMVHTCYVKSSEKYERWEESESTLHRWPKSWEICGCTRLF